MMVVVLEQDSVADEHSTGLISYGIKVVHKSNQTRAYRIEMSINRIEAATKCADSRAFTRWALTRNQRSASPFLKQTARHIYESRK